MDQLNYTVLLAGVVTYLVSILRGLPSKIFNYVKHYFSVSISVTSSHFFPYYQLNNYLSHIDKKVLKNNLSKYNLGHDTEAIIEDGMGINFGNYTIMINRLTWMSISKTKSEHVTEGRHIETINISILGLHQKDEIEKIKKSMEQVDKDDIMCFSSFGMGLKVAKRDFDDVFVEDKQELIDFIENWKNNKDLFEKHGIIFKSGILLHGSPGTGKSTLVRAIATYLKMNIQSINIGSYRSVSDLENRLCNLDNSIVLFEDIDCSLTKRDPNSTTVDKNTMNIGTVLNILDGITSPSGTLFIATTNHLDKIDDAVLRDCRFDLKFEVDNISKDLACEMCKRFDVEESIITNETFPINPSYLQNKIIRFKMKL